MAAEHRLQSNKIKKIKSLSNLQPLNLQASKWGQCDICGRTTSRSICSLLEFSIKALTGYKRLHYSRLRQVQTFTVKKTKKPRLTWNRWLYCPATTAAITVMLGCGAAIMFLKQLTTNLAIFTCSNGLKICWLWTFYIIYPLYYARSASFLIKVELFCPLLSDAYDLRWLFE